MDTYTPTSRTQVRRLPKRATYDKEQVHAILDEGYICHVGFVVDGQPFVIPTGYARFGDQLYIHGSSASRMLRSTSGGVDVCVTVTLVDGFVLARSVFHHSMNYRSEEKRAALRYFTNHIVAGRWEEARQPNDQELKATSVLALAIEEVSAKVRTGPPVDDEEDYSIPIWAGVVPVRQEAGEPLPDDRVLAGIPAVDVERVVVR
jgi:nitroimidazol reductase NimA-like FMN-containing flavoprotein (pyridoxamine 5'-phosphate oxidase superfamily)